MGKRTKLINKKFKDLKFQQLDNINIVQIIISDIIPYPSSFFNVATKPLQYLLSILLFAQRYNQNSFYKLNILINNL